MRYIGYVLTLKHILNTFLYARFRLLKIAKIFISLINSNELNKGKENILIIIQNNHLKL